ncbi:MAG: tetratricopeptide repeat protein [Gammaproteobacteria bacterium]|nr:tetratricopeptide repeat protein [Gammaproteobacteria bacterium]
MDTHATEDQQIAALKKWWKSNSGSIVTGIILGLAVLFGTKAWFAWQDKIARQASDVYAVMMTALQNGNNQAVTEKAGVLIADFSNTPYAALAALSLARLRIEDGELDAAATQLQWVLDNGGTDYVRDTARLRLARVKLAQGDPDAAESVLGNAGSSSAAEALFSEVRGDIHLARGDRDQALASYQRALASMSEDFTGRALLQLKYDDLVSSTAAAGTAQ